MVRPFQTKNNNDKHTAAQQRLRPQTSTLLDLGLSILWPLPRATQNGTHGSRHRCSDHHSSSDGRIEEGPGSRGCQCAEAASAERSLDDAKREPQRGWKETIEPTAEPAVAEGERRCREAAGPSNGRKEKGGQPGDSALLATIAELQATIRELRAEITALCKAGPVQERPALATGRQGSGRQPESGCRTSHQAEGGNWEATQQTQLAQTHTDAVKTKGARTRTRVVTKKEVRNTGAPLQPVA